MKRFNDREMAILKELVNLNRVDNRLKFPTIAAFLQDSYFRKNKNAFLVVCMQLNSCRIYVSTALSEDKRREQYYNVFEMIFLFQWLLRERYISLIAMDVIDHTKDYFMNPHLGEGEVYEGYTIFSSAELMLKDNNFCDLSGKILYDCIQINDTECHDIVVNFVSKSIFISKDLIFLVDNKFMTPDEIFAKKTLIMGWCANITALIIGIASIIIGLISIAKND